MEQNIKNSDKKSLSFMFAKVTTENVTKSAITFDFLDGFSKFKLKILWHSKHYQMIQADPKKEKKKSCVVATISKPL